MLAACGPAAPGEVPVNDAELRAWVESAQYAQWAAEPDVHPGLGPHFGDVRVFVNEELERSLAAGTAPHPVASAAVKELYGDGDEIRGWAVMVKVADGTEADTWYWWEVYDGDTLIDRVGADVCESCHSDGVDRVLTDTF
jgi:hypothetical protein